jgi:hypothetical protein
VGSCGGTEESNLHRVAGSPLLYLVISFTENLSERYRLENRGGGKVILQWILETGCEETNRIYQAQDCIYCSGAA